MHLAYGREDDPPPLRGAIIGFGTIAQGHVAGYAGLPDVRIAGVVDPSAERRGVAEATLPGVRTFTSTDDLVHAVALDFVDVCCPPVWHAEYVCRALDAGLHVLCEKPVVVTPDELSDINVSLAASDATLFPCHNYKYSPAMTFLRSTVDQAAFGGVVAGHFRTYRRGHAVGVGEWRPHWRRESAVSGGGIIQDHGWHSVYLACHLVGATPIAVSCLAGELASHRALGNEDTALLTLHFDGDVRVVIELSWTASFRETTYLVVGTEQSVFVDGDNVVHIRSQGSAGHASSERQRIASEFDDPLHGGWFRAMFRDFRAALSDPDRQIRHLNEAVTTALVIDAAYQSAADGGRPVVVAPSTLEAARAITFEA